MVGVIIIIFTLGMLIPRKLYCVESYVVLEWVLPLLLAFIRSPNPFSSLSLLIEKDEDVGLYLLHFKNSDSSAFPK